MNNNYDHTVDHRRVMELLSLNGFHRYASHINDREKEIQKLKRHLAMAVSKIKELKGK